MNEPTGPKNMTKTKDDQKYKLAEQGHIAPFHLLPSSDLNYLTKFTP